VGLEALRIKNLRCLSDTSQIPIRPITVLVGRNSSGKSTFLRAFPLLRQSVQTATESPILWYRERYVDFGSLQDAINDEASERSVTFEFSVTLPGGAGVAVGTPVWVDVAMTLAEGQPPKGAYVQAYEVKCLGHTASLRFTPLGKLESFHVNGADVLPRPAEMSLGGSAYLLPMLHPDSYSKVAYPPVSQPLRLGPLQDIDYEPERLLENLAQKLLPLFQANIGDDRILDIADRLRIGPLKAMWQTLLDASRGLSLKKDFLAEGASGPTFAPIVNRTFARLVPWILDAVDPHVADFMDRVAYLGPLRATAERSYRVQDLSVNDVDPDGKNLAMFMRSLSEPELQSFAAFTREHLGFEAKVHSPALHAEIHVKELHASRHRNLVDIGFGYTEVLPLMAILWSTCCRERSNGDRPTSLLAIEQPELHLHPAHQVRLAGVIAGAWRASRDAKREVKIMVETHSEGIVNGLGELIRKGVISAADVQIVLFDQDAETRRTEVRLAGYAEDGALNDDWPFGFFAPVADD
jgi:predicted ATPase